MKDVERLVRVLTDPSRLTRFTLAVVEDALPLVAAVAGGCCAAAVLYAALRSARDAHLRSDARRIQILAPPEVAASGATTLWMGLHAILRPAWRRAFAGQPHLSWEIVADPGHVAVYMWVPRVVPPGLVERAVESAWPGARTTIVESDGVVPPDASTVAATDLVLAEPEWFPIGEAPDDDPLRLAIGTMTALAEDERAVVQVLARPATSGARRRMQRAAREARKASAITAAPYARPGAVAGRSGGRTVLDPTVDPDVRAILSRRARPCGVAGSGWRCSRPTEAARGDGSMRWPVRSGSSRVATASVECVCAVV